MGIHFYIIIIIKSAMGKYIKIGHGEYIYSVFVIVKYEIL